MKNSIRAALFVLIASLVSAALHADDGFRYVVGSVTTRDLGTFGGRSSGATDINDAGYTVGWAMTPTPAVHAFVHRAGIMSDIGSTLEGAQSRATAINSSNVVVGTWSRDGAKHAVQWIAGAPVTLNHAWLAFPIFPPAPPMDATAAAISNVGLIVGDRTTRNRLTAYATVWTDTLTFHSIDGTYSRSGRALDINDSGLVVGYAGTAPKAWQVYPPFSEAIDIPGFETCVVGETPIGAANGVNRFGGIVGNMSCVLPSRRVISHAFYWNGVSEFSTDLGVLPDAGRVEAFDINDSGFIVGQIWLVVRDDVVSSAYIYHRDFGMYLLPKLPETREFGSCTAAALNNINANRLVQVVGDCGSTLGEHAVRWDVTLVRRSTRPPGTTP